MTSIIPSRLPTNRSNEAMNKLAGGNPRNYHIFKKTTGMAALILVLALAGCIPQPPSQPGTPPAANGQAILGWGGNSSGQIGDGTMNQRMTPVPVTLKDLRAIAASGDYSMALTMDGRVLEWGGGANTPTEVTGLASVKQIAAGARHRLALKQDGTVWAWGDNNHGQLGDGGNTPRATPVQVAGLTSVSAIAAGGEHSLAILSDLSLRAWGANGAGQLGDGTQSDRSTPVTVPGIQVIEVAAAAQHTVALTSDVRVIGWGSNQDCQLGIDPPPGGELITEIVCSNHPTPNVIFAPSTPPRPSSTGRAIAATDSMTLFVLSSGSVYAVGGMNGPDPQKLRGICNVDAVFGPAYVPLLTSIKEVVAGSSHALFLSSTGEVWALGANLAGQGGLGTPTVEECAHAVTPTQVRGVSMLAAGKEHSLALIKGSLSLAPSSVDFGNQPVGTGSPAARDITVTNSGLAPVTIYSTGISGLGDYSLVDDCPDQPATLAPNAICKVSVSFAPAATGNRSGNLVLVSDAFGGQQQVSLTGKGTEASVAFLPLSINFGSQTAGTTGAAQTVTVQNTGDAPLLINKIEATAGFTIINDSCPKSPTAVPVQGSCIVEVAFSPTVAGAALGELRLTFEPNSKLASMRLEGTGN